MNSSTIGGYDESQKYRIDGASHRDDLTNWIDILESADFHGYSIQKSCG